MACTAALALASAGCGANYYVRTMWGGARILVQRQPIERLVADPRTDDELRARLAYVRQARDFASRHLGLPDNKSYRTYSEVRRGGERSAHVVWNVVAAPEFSVEPLTWCFPVAGCVAYRGYFSQRRARRFGDSLEREGYDVDVYGVRAYSTLGRFADPVLSTFLDGSDATAVAGYLFHELAHQVAYAPGDTTFNESFATLVEQEGLRRWLESRGEREQLEAYRERSAHDAAFRALVLDYRARLAATYAAEQSDERKRAEKTRLIQRLEDDYRRLAAGWAGDRRWDGWFDGQVDNADFALMASYHGLVPALLRLLERQDHDLPAFYREVERLAGLDPAERSRSLGLE